MKQEFDLMVKHWPECKPAERFAVGGSRLWLAHRFAPKRLYWSAYLVSMRWVSTLVSTKTVLSERIPEKDSDSVMRGNRAKRQQLHDVG